LDTLVEKLKTTYQDADAALLEKAFEFAQKAHKGQSRLSGDPYFVHPYEVASILGDMGMDIDTVVAGLLHDTIEDTDVSIEDIKKEFGPGIALLVDGVTKMGLLEYKTREEQQAESLRKMILAMADDIRVIIIKLADRLHNMRTLKFQPPEKQREKANETLEIYAPLAHRLGISRIKWELEDLALKYLEPDAFYGIADKLAATRSERENMIEKVTAEIKERLAKVYIEADIDGRPKHIYSIYEKMKQKGKTFEEIYDLIAIRIIVNSVKDCYGVLGIVHTLWKPIPGRFKDYIAVPKQNMYQSLHTTLLGEDGKPFEVQIRTVEMHRTAEYGIAAHWKYKEGGQRSSYDDKLIWLREILEWQKDLKDSKEFMDSIKLDFFKEEVFVFTPKGEVKDFVKGATPIDFAYAIHSAIGDKCIGAKVSGKMVPLDYTLQTGDIVEIVTSGASKGPSRDWLKIAKTTQAKSKIRNWFKRQSKDENIAKGREMLEKEAKRYGFEFQKLFKPEWIKSIFKKFTINSIEDMYAMVGYGGISTSTILTRLIEEFRKANKAAAKLEIKRQRKDKVEEKDGITVKGYGGMVIRFAKCCNPVPGDDIIGYITRGRGVSVHRRDCSNINETDFEEGRLIEVAWVSDERSAYEVEIEVLAADRPGLIAEITGLIYDMNVSITAINARTGKNKMANVKITLEIKNIKHLQDIIKKLKDLNGITDVYRINN
jgi:guanosine-3',5'-bis(diphosphate) 3'-pyrophosphohydrolase